MAQATLNASVVLFGRVDNSIGKLGSALVSIGGTIDQMSQKLIDFGKESAQVYRDYEDSMLDAQVALSTIYGRNTRELSSVMKDLTAQTTEWAATTIFHTNDVANAVAQAAHAGWDEQKILSGIPAAMQLAQAGGLDLSQSVDYIIKSTNAAGISFGDLTDFIDEWTYAANRSAGDVESFGEAMTRMGSTMRFADNRQELLTMLAVLHDAGTTGSDAGTLLRNSMIRLVAPTKKATDAMAELGVTQADIDEAMGEVDGDAAGAVRQLEALGFSAYDSQGNLKDFLTIFRDLGAATKDMSEDERYNIWSSIFPTRTITGAMALMNAAMGEGFELYDMLTNGAAEGYGRYASETMMSGMTGAVETLLSKWERLQQVTGANLAPQIEEIAGALGKVIDVLAAGGADNGVSAGLDIAVRAADWLGTIAENAQNMDPATFDAISAALGVVAGMGPALLITGGALRLIGTMFSSKLSMIAVAALAMVSVAEAVKALKEANFKEAFGTMDLDTAPLLAELGTLKTAFEESTSEITQYSGALDSAIASYESAATTFSSQMLTDAITGAKLDETDLKNYETMGEQMVTALMEGVHASGDLSASALLWLAGGENTDDPIFKQIVGNLSAAHDENIAKIEALSQSLRDATTEAFADGKLTEEERENIQNIIREMNEVAAQAQEEAENTRRRAQLIAKGQSLSYDSVSAFVNGEVAEQRAQEELTARSIYQAAYSPLSNEYNRKLAAAQTDAERAAIEAEYQPQFDYLQTGLNERLAEIGTEYADMIDTIFTAAIRDSEYGDADRWLSGMVGDVQAGNITPEMARNQMQQNWGGSAESMNRLYGEQIEALGGNEAVTGMIGYYDKIGDSYMSGRLRDLMTKYEIANMAVTDTAIQRATQYAQGMTGAYYLSYEDVAPLFGYGKAPTAQSAAPTSAGQTQIGTSNAAEAGAEMATTIEGELNPVDASVAFPNAASEASAARAAIEQQFSAPITQYVTVQSWGAAGGGASLFTSALPRKASGGRETQPAIFAEAGPEWFIPEAHTRNTAALLLSAARASGFSLAELAAMGGASLFADGGVYGGALDWGELSDDGGSGSGGGSSFQVQYSPVIHADNAEGVDRALLADKKRLEKWFSEWWSRKELYESVVQYT